MSTPKISVIVPVYGVEKFIEQSLRSLFEQTKSEGVEFIIVNDCTKDKSMDIARDIIAEYPSLDIKIIEHKVNSGSAVTRQTGLDCATGDYILYIDSDDWCELTMLEEMYGAITASGADMVVCDEFASYENIEIYKSNSSFPNNGVEATKQLLRRKASSPLWNKMIKRSVILDNNISFVPKINMCEDFIFVVKVCAFANKVAYHPKSFLHYRQVESSIAHSLTRLDMLGWVQDVVGSFETFFREQNMYDQYYEDLLHLKLSMRITLVMNSEVTDLHKYADLYPETIEIIEATSGCTRMWKKVHILLFKGQLNRAKILVMIIRLYRRVKNRKQDEKVLYKK